MANDTDEGIFGRKNKGGQGAIVKQVQQDNAALALAHKQVGKLATLVASGNTVTADAQRLLLFLASYGDGERMGKYVFTSGELCGLPAAKKAAGQSKVKMQDPDMSPNDPLNVARERIVDDFVTVPASPPTDDGVALGLEGPKLNDAVKVLVSRAWAKTTDDGEFGIGCDFNELSLTEAGRMAAQGAVKKAGLKAGASFESFDGLPGLFDEPGSVGFGGAAQAERDQLTSMLARAKIGFGVDHVEDEGVSVVSIKGKNARVEFTFNTDGQLEGVGLSKAGGEAAPAEPSKASEADEVTSPNAKGRRNDTSGG